MAQLEQVGYFPAGVIPLSNDNLDMNKVSTMSDLARRRKWKESKIAPYEDMVVDEFGSGSSLSQIQKKLSYNGVSATRYTILCYVRSLPLARLNATTKNQP